MEIVIPIFESISKSKKLNKEQFLKLSTRQKNKYLKEFPKSSHRYLMPGASKKKHFTVKKKPFGKKKEVVEHSNNFPAVIQKKENEANRNLLRLEHSEYQKDFKNFINRESVNAIAKIEPRDLIIAGRNIAKNKEQIAERIYDTFETKPGIFEAGVSSVQKAFRGEKLTPKERKSSTQLIATAAKYALLAAGVVVIATAAAPVAIIIARLMHESWGTLDELSGDKAIRDKKRAEKENELEEAKRLEKEAWSPEEKLEHEKERLANMLAAKKISQHAYEKAIDNANIQFERRIKRKKKEKAEASVIYEPTYDETASTVDHLIDGIGDFITNLDLDELKERAAGSFKGVSNSTQIPFLFANIRNICVDNDCELPIQNIRTGLHGICTQNNNWISKSSALLKENGFEVESFVLHNNLYKVFSHNYYFPIVLTCNAEAFSFSYYDFYASAAQAIMKSIFDDIAKILTRVRARDPSHVQGIVISGKVAPKKLNETVDKIKTLFHNYDFVEHDIQDGNPIHIVFENSKHNIKANIYAMNNGQISVHQLVPVEGPKNPSTKINMNP